MSSKAPMKRIDCAVVATKNYVFLVPVKSVGFFVVLNTIKTHQLFEGKSVHQGIEDLIASCSSPSEIEEKFCALLEDNPMYVFKISELSTFKIKGFLGKHTAMMRRSLKEYASILPNGKGNSKEMRLFFGQ